MKKEIRTDLAYKGYVIRTGLLGDFFIGKDNYFFSCVRTLEEAKKTVDQLVD